MKRKYYVYRHRTTTDGRVFYVGCGDEKRPYYTHKSLRSKEWLDIYNNEGLVVEILHITTVEEEALELEELIIREYGRIKDGGTLVNKALFKCNGGIKGKTHTEETKQKICIANKGKKRSEETKQKMSESNKGKKRSEETKRKMSQAKNKVVLQYSKDGMFIKKWPSVTIVSEELNINRGNICNACNGKIKTAGSYIWKYKEE